MNSRVHMASMVGLLAVAAVTGACSSATNGGAQTPDGGGAGRGGNGGIGSSTGGRLGAGGGSSVGGVGGNGTGAGGIGAGGAVTSDARTDAPAAEGGTTVDSQVPPADMRGGPADLSGDGGSGDGASMAVDGSAVQDGAAAINCKQSGLLYCEDFESDLPALWEQISFTGVIARDSNRSYRGRSSFHASVTVIPTKTAWARLSQTMFVPTPDLYMRSFVYLPKGSAMNDMVFMMTDDPKGYSAIGLGFTRGKMEIWSWGDTAASGTDAEAFPVDRWVCVEWHLHRAATKSLMDVWRDDRAILTATSVSNGPKLPAIWAGLYSNSNNQAGSAELWYDDVAIDNKRIGCSK